MACNYIAPYAALNMTYSEIEFEFISRMIGEKPGISKAISFFGVVSSTVRGWFKNKKGIKE